MSWKAEYVVLLLISTLVGYGTALCISQSTTQKAKNVFLGLCLLINLGLLFFFKYFNFFSDSVRIILQQFSIPLDPITVKVLLPIGISFYTFQTLSYVIDVYRGEIKPERHVGIFAVYVSFFPQLVAGPIERAKNLLPQFFENHSFEYKRATDGLKLMLWGFFKKVVIADRLAVTVNTIYNDPTGYTGIPLLLATVFFGFQIYCDFSGYSDIAIGSAQVMGFKLMDNFKRPYFSRSVREFWRRWHISLSTWFMDYVYIPLGGSRVSVPRWCANMMIVFIVSGLWHGANWTFILWGIIHGVYILFEKITQPLKGWIIKITALGYFPRLVQMIEITVTFALVTFAWIFFRANSLTDAWYIATHLFQGMTLNFSGVNLGPWVGWTELLIIFSMIALMELVHIIQEHRSMRQFLDDKPLLLRWSLYVTLIVVVLVFGVYEQTPFIYFQF